MEKVALRPVEEEEEDDSWERTLKTCGTYASRSFFLAGYSYYEAGRNGFARHDDKWYLALVMGTFCFAVMSAVTADIIKYFVSALSETSLKNRFVKLVAPFTQLGYLLFQIALMLYLASFTRVGWTYYADSPARWIPFGGALLFGILLGAMQWHMSTERQRAVSGFYDVSMGTPTGPQRRFQMEPAWKNVENVTPFLRSQAEVLADKAVYLAGFSQAGVARFMTTDDSRGYVYIVFATLASMLSILAAFQLTNLLIMLSTFDNDRHREIFARNMFKIWKYTSGSFFIGLLMTMFSLVFMGWGTAFPDEAWITATVGSVGIVTLLWAMGRGDKAYVQATSLEEQPGDDDPLYESTYEPLVKSANAISFPAAVASGFVFYNVVTFSTDILALDFTDNWPKSFLALNAVTLAFGIIGTVLASLIVVWIQDLPRKRQKALMARSIDPIAKVCYIAFQASLLCFMAVFAMFGITKLSPRRVEPLIATIFGIIAILAGMAFIVMARKRSMVAALRVSGPSNDAARMAAEALQKALAEDNVKSANLSKRRAPKLGTPLTDIPGSQRRRIAQESLAPVQVHASASFSRTGSQLGNFAGRSLFFGAFAFFCINFLFTSREVTGFYVSFLGLSFVSAMVLVSWSTFYTLWGESITTDGHKAAYAAKIQTLPVIGYYAFLVSLFSFLIGFCMIGYVKPVKDYGRYAVVMLVSGILAVMLCGVVVLHVTLAWRKVSNATAESLHSRMGKINHKRWLDVITSSAGQASFVAGNVLFEVLFSDVGKKPYLNYMYFILTSITMSTGAVVVVMGTVCEVFVQDLNGDIRRGTLVKALENFPGYSFLLQTVSLMAWILSIIPFSPVKKWPMWRLSVSLGSATTLISSLVLARLSVAYVTVAANRRSDSCARLCPTPGTRPSPFFAVWLVLCVSLVCSLLAFLFLFTQ